jgi:hypothetical protein
MSDELHRLEKPFTLRRWIRLTIWSAANVLVIYYRPFANLPGIEAFAIGSDAGAAARYNG